MALDLDSLPKKTGVYVFRGRRSPQSNPTVLYVGKAKNLFTRVRQYFVGPGDGRPFVEFLRTRVEDIETIVVDTEQDALLLENELIKKHRPAYNIHLKDDKRYLSLRLDTRREWPQIEVTRKIKKDGATYLGPFSSASRLRSTLDFMQKLFPLRTCDDRKLYNRTRPCLEYEIKRCVAPCVQLITKEAYADLVSAALLFLKGKNEELLERLKKEMADFAEAENFEAAAQIRDRLRSIESVTTGQGVIGLQQFRLGLDQDALGLARDGRRVVITQLFVRNGIILDKRTTEFEDLDPEMDDASLLEEFINRYYSSDVYIPDELLCAHFIETEGELKIIVPRSEEKQGFLSIAQENAKMSLEASSKRREKMTSTLEGLQRALNLSRIPRIMDCVDISHHQGAETVASVVRFMDGQPSKDGYRRIKLSEDQVDDFESMREALDRRYKIESDLPDLLVIDGGRGQLSSAIEILTTKGWLSKFDLVALAKARDLGDEEVDPLNPKGRERVFKPNQKNPILLKENSSEELVLQYLRDEAHRFAITYHRYRRAKALSASLLDSIKGISEKTKLRLLRDFGSVEGVAAARDEDLLKIISPKTLEALRLTLEEPSEEDET